MGPDQLSVALMPPYADEYLYKNEQELILQFAQGIITAFAKLGICADIGHNQILQTEGRKLADLGIHQTASGGFLFHALILVGLDIEHMFKVLNTPSVKTSDGEITTLAARTSAIRNEIGWEISIEEVRERIAKAYADWFDGLLIQSGFSVDERRSIDKLELKKYMNSEWVFEKRCLPA